MTNFLTWCHGMKIFYLSSEKAFKKIEKPKHICFKIKSHLSFDKWLTKYYFVNSNYFVVSVASGAVVGKLGT